MIDELMIDEIQATSHHYPATQKICMFSAFQELLHKTS